MTRFAPDSRRLLLRIARDAIAEALEGRPYEPKIPEQPELLEPVGAFVSLHAGGALRGCIGNLESSAPLYRTVAKMARSAAFEDPRFARVERREMAQIELEISVLSPLEKLDDPSRVVVGRHGLCVLQSGCRGVLLPQVAVEQGWCRNRFLEETCHKAGLPRNAWKRGAEIFVFEAIVFGEKDG